MLVVARIISTSFTHVLLSLQRTLVYGQGSGQAPRISERFCRLLSFSQSGLPHLSVTYSVDHSCHI
jgi:hypothetical protein